MGDVRDIETGLEQDHATFEELVSMLKGGMDEEQAFEWARTNDLKITEEQLDYLERDLEIFEAEAMLRPDYNASESDIETALKHQKEAEKKAREARRLTPKEKREAMMGALKAFIIVILVIGVYLYFL